ncbi:MAG: hypothetical protein QF578_19215 [Alphaproteobacteria bacterium]|nr:hypothetical protein [Alphaproteobacteria bacterium]MDP6566966.1 hypothetical protein [Alphaproteobacteria bacterium]MDP6816027.1 hypothetical protein [Alphaproteobacteria bacterium]
MGLVSRVVEERGIATVNVSTGRDITANVRPPRSVFINHPMGNPFGRPGQREMQREVLMHALRLLENGRTPGELIDLPYDWGEEVKTIYDLEFAFKPAPPDPVTGKQRY